MSRTRRLAWGVAVVGRLAGIVFWLKGTGDISTARVGKCVSLQGGATKVVSCDATEAQYKIVGRFDHKTRADSDGHLLCSAIPETVLQFWYGKEGQTGVVW